MTRKLLTGLALGVTALGLAAAPAATWAAPNAGPTAKAPEPAAAVAAAPAKAKAPALTFKGLGKLKLGMTVAQAKKADRTLKVKSGDDCRAGKSKWARVWFNPNGKLASIAPVKAVKTSTGIGRGSTYAQAKRYYRIKTTMQSTEAPSFVSITAKGKEVKYPSKKTIIVFEFDYKGAAIPGKPTFRSITQSKVLRMTLERNQQCAN